MRLTAEEKQEIRALYATGLHTQTELAARYGVAQAWISSIIRYPAHACADCGVPIAGSMRCDACKAAHITQRQAAYRDRNRERINQRSARLWAESEHYREQHRRIARESERRRYVRKRG